MKMLVQAALERDDGRGLCGRQLEVVEEEIRRLERSIQVFLEFARPVSPRMSSFDLTEAVRQTLELVGTRSRNQGVKLDCDLPDAPLLMVAGLTGPILRPVLALPVIGHASWHAYKESVGGDDRD